MNHSTLVTAQLKEPLRAYALTIEEAAPGEFKWRILENHGSHFVFDPVCCSDITFAAYDTALATGYGELQRLIGPDLQFGPRREPHAAPPPWHVKRETPASTAPLRSPVNPALNGAARAGAPVNSVLDKAEEARV